MKKNLSQYGKWIAGALCATALAFAVAPAIQNGAVPEEGNIPETQEIAAVSPENAEVPGTPEFQSDTVQDQAPAPEAAPEEVTAPEPAPAEVPDGGGQQAAEESPATYPAYPESDDKLAEHVPGKVLVQIRNQDELNALNEYLATSDAIATKQVTEADGVLEWYELDVAEGVEAVTAMSEIDKAGIGHGVQPEYVYHLQDDGFVPGNSLESVSAEEGMTVGSTENGVPSAIVVTYDAQNGDKALPEGASDKLASVSIGEGSFSVPGQDVAPDGYALIGWFNAPNGFASDTPADKVLFLPPSAKVDAGVITVNREYIDAYGNAARAYEGNDQSNVPAAPEEGTLIALSDYADGSGKVTLYAAWGVIEQESASSDEQGDIAPDASNISPDATSSAWTPVMNDPRTTSQWGMRAINLDAAYNYKKTLSSTNRPTVAILDTGCDVSHEDLAANIVTFYDAVTPESPKITDVHGHGTHVAGIISAVTDNGIGITGTSLNSAKILPVRVFKNEGGGLSATTISLLRGYEYVIDNAKTYNIKLVNMSLGAEMESDTELGSDDHAVLRAIDKAYAAGVMTVCSAGNNGYQRAYPNFPATCSTSALGVIAAYAGPAAGAPSRPTWEQTEFYRGDYSNYNRSGRIDFPISAPGSNVLSTWTSNRYAEKSGTSMACPCVTGVAALVWSANPNLTPEQVKSILFSTARDMEAPGFDEGTGFGLVNAEAAIKAAVAGNSHLSGHVFCLAGGTTTLTPPSGGQWNWTSSNTSVATVSQGRVTGVGPGRAVITATNGTRKLYQVVTVFSVSMSGPSTCAAGGTSVYTLNNSTLPTGEWVWSISNTSIASIGELNGKLTTRRGGEEDVIATLVADPNVKLTKRVTISTLNLSSATVTMSGWTYDSTAHTPSPTVKIGNITVPASAYTVSYANNVNAGTCTVTVTAKPGTDYTGTATGRCTVSPAPMSSVTVSGIAEQKYTGSACTPKPAVTWRGGYGLKEGTDYVLSYANNVNVGTATVTVTGKGNFAGTAQTTFRIVSSGASPSPTPTPAPNPSPRPTSIKYMTHVQNIGWQGAVADGAMSGTSGRALRLEGFKAVLENREYSGSIRYRTHIQNIGWESNWKYDGDMSGTSGRALRLEAIQLELTGDMARYYDVYYRVHCQNFGWLGWAKNGVSAGSAGFGYRLEGIQVQLVRKGGAAPGSTSNAFMTSSGGTSGIPDSESYVIYNTHIQNIGWQSWMRDGEMSGTSGQSLRLEGINIKLGGKVPGGIRYKTHVQNIGWQDWKYNGDMSGTSGRALRLEAICIELTGEAAQKYDVYYRVHCQNFGWMGWAKNGAQAGSAGYGYRLEGIQIQLVPKGGAAPGSTANSFRQR